MLVEVRETKSVLRMVIYVPGVEEAHKMSEMAKSEEFKAIMAKNGFPVESVVSAKAKGVT